MKQFESLTKIGQVRRLRQLAETALPAYDLGETRLTPLMHFFNTTFRVDACSRSTQTCQPASALPANERYVLRIHRPGSQDASTIRSELLWLLALRHEANLVVPEPVARRDGGGWGHYLFDIGVSFSTLLTRLNYQELRRAFLTGYRRERPLSTEHEALIDTFIAARLMCHVL